MIVISFPGGLREGAVEGADAEPTFLLSRAKENATIWNRRNISYKIANLMMIRKHFTSNSK